MNEKPLERLNYYNGQRLEASDLKTEQEYHIRTRRWLNKSLYSAGIARGLEVRIITEGPKEGTPYVSVSPGLALDNEGREIILLEEETVEVCSFSGTDESTVVGNYLVIEYAEESIAYEKGGCAVRTEGKGAAKSTAPMGGPSRIQSTVKFSWMPFVPHPGSNQIVLAQVELKDGCKSVGQIDRGERRYIGAASAATVKQYALEGERHIDKDNPGRIYFHIRGRQPSSVTLYLRAEQFSTLYYTELGQHDHGLTYSVSAPNKIDGHTHNIAGHSTVAKDTQGNSIDGQHPHTIGNVTANTSMSIWDGLLLGAPLIPFSGFVFPGNVTTGAATAAAVANEMNVGLALSPRIQIAGIGNIISRDDLKTRIGLDISINDEGVHSHFIPQAKTQPNILSDNEGPPSHTHTVVATAVSNPGAIGTRVRDGVAFSFVDDLQVFIGKSVDGLQNKTIPILAQLRDAQPSVTWDQLGNGNSNHVLAQQGTGTIRLDFLPGVSFEEGEHVIDLRVVSGGGRIHYNLYIE